jgi:hypothetical protein
VIAVSVAIAHISFKLEYELGGRNGMTKNILACAGRGSFGLAAVNTSSCLLWPLSPRYRETISDIAITSSFSCTCGCVIQTDEQIGLWCLLQV